MNEYTKQAGERVRIRRKRLKLSQEQLAEKIGYKGRGPVSKLESGDNAFKQPLVAKLAEALKTTPAYIMGWDEEPEEPRPIKTSCLSRQCGKSQLSVKSPVAFRSQRWKSGKATLSCLNRSTPTLH